MASVGCSPISVSYLGGPSSSSSRRFFLPVLFLPSSSSSSSCITIRTVTMTASPSNAFSLGPSTNFLQTASLLAKSNSSIHTVSSLGKSAAAAAATGDTSRTDGKSRKQEQKQKQKQVSEIKEEAEEEEVEEDLPWIQEKALDLVEFTGSVTQAIPGPRVGRSSLPWIVAIPLAYFAVTFVIAFAKTVSKFNSPKEIRRKLVNKNAMLCKSIDELFEKGRDGVEPSTLNRLMQKTGFSMEEILRKYTRYALNEKPFNPEFVANLIHLRKASLLDDSQVAEILNEISRRIVKDKGPVVMDMSGYSEKGFKRKLAVQALFGKVYYLSQLPEFCSSDSSLIVKEIFGVADEDAEKLRLHTLSEAGDLDSLERMIDGADSEDSSGGSTNTP